MTSAERQRHNQETRWRLKIVPLVSLEVAPVRSRLRVQVGTLGDGKVASLPTPGWDAATVSADCLMELRRYLESFICVCRHGHGGSAHLLLHNPRLICTCGWWQDNGSVWKLHIRAPPFRNSLLGHINLEYPSHVLDSRVLFWSRCCESWSRLVSQLVNYADLTLKKVTTRDGCHEGQIPRPEQMQRSQRRVYSETALKSFCITDMFFAK